MQWITLSRCALSPFLLVAIATAQEPEIDFERDWWQWGGPTRNFVARAAELQPSWQGAAKPVELFRRALLGGHSSIGFVSGRVFVVHGKAKTERVLALTELGETLWEREYRVGYGSSVDDYDGPHSAPLVLEASVITVAIDSTVRAWNLEDGSLLWMRDLRRDHGVTLPQAGYAASPLLIGDSILLPGLGGDGPGLSRTEAPGLGVLRLDTRTGQTIWGKQAFPSSHASPILVPLEDRQIAVFHGLEDLVAVDPQTGEESWRFEVRSGASDNVSFTPLWDSDSSILFLSHAYDQRGAQAIRIDPQGGPPERVWSSSRLKVEHGNAVLWNGMWIASDGGEPGFLVALDSTRGELLWKERAPKATFLRVGEQMVLWLDADGALHLAKPTRDGSGIISRLDVLDELSWTVPTLVGRTLLLRGPTTLVALRLP